jgi:hypothetical protein
VKINANETAELAAYLAGLDELARKTGVTLAHYEGVQVATRSGSILRLYVRDVNAKNDAPTYYEHYLAED